MTNSARPAASQGTGLPRVDFYHLPDDNPRKLLLFTCRLTEKAWKLGNRIFILCGNDREYQQLDQLLWSWRDTGFLPHAPSTAAHAADTPVLLGEQLPADADFDLVINPGADIHTQIDSLTPHTRRIAEIIDQNPNRKQTGRLRYSYYDKNNYPIEYHEILTRQ